MRGGLVKERVCIISKIWKRGRETRKGQNGEDERRRWERAEKGEETNPGPTRRGQSGMGPA